MEVRFSASDNRFDSISTGHPHFSLRGAYAWASYREHHRGKVLRAEVTGNGSRIHEEPFEDVHGSGTQQVIHCVPKVDGIELVYRVKNYTDQPFTLLQISIKNLTPEPIYLEECCLLELDRARGGEVRLGKAHDGLRFFKAGWHGWDYSGARGDHETNSGGLIARLTSLSYTNPGTRRVRKKGEFSSEGWALLASDECCLVAGFVSMAAQFGQVYACIRPGEIALSLITQMDGVRLDPGEVRHSDWGYLQAVALPHPEPYADYAEAVGRQMQARVPAQPPPAMWTHWYQYFHDIDETRYLQTLDVLTAHKAEFPCIVTELDDGYQSAWGDWTTTNAQFSHGLEWLAGEVRQKGYLPGLWLAPFAAQLKSELVRNHPDWLVKNERGKPANAGFVYNMFIHALDLSLPAVQEHLKNLAHQLTNEWGYRMLKIDFLNAGAIPGRRSDPKLTRAEALRMGLEAIREGAGEETFLLGCGCPFGPAVGIVDAMRIGPDTAPSWLPYFNWMEWVSPLVKSNPNMPSLRNAMRNTLNLSSLHQRWWWNDPDCLLVRESGSRLTEAEVQSAVTLVGLSGGMLILSDDLKQVSPDRLRWVSRLLPNLGLRGLPLNPLENEMPQVYMLKLEHAGQRWQVVGIFNWNDYPADLRLKFDQLGYKERAALHIFDYWQETYQRMEGSEIIFHAIPAHGCKLLRVCEESEPLQVVGDTLHISMGAEINTLRIVNGAVEVELVDMGRRVEGKVWVWTGEGVVQVEVRN